MNRETGALVISLDFELIWGVFDKVNLSEKESYFNNTLYVVPHILKLFGNYQIQATWATVGMLFNKNWDEWNQNIPQILPEYSNTKLNPYIFGKNIQNLKTQKFCFAPNLIKNISETNGQELATHTYSHYYCLEPGQTELSYNEDLKKAINLASNLGVNLKSLVFPRNQVNMKYLQLSVDLGIKNFRSNPDTWYWKNTQKDSIETKVFRTADAYLGFYSKSYRLNKEWILKNQYSLQKASRLLRPYSSNKILNKLKLRHILNEMSKAAKNKEIYHLWWHPHNFGNHPTESLEDLETLLKHFQRLKNKYGFESLNMKELANLI